MLEIIEQRENILEITDTELINERKRRINQTNIFLVILMVSLITTILLLFIPSLSIYAILLLALSGISFYFARKTYGSHEELSIQGFSITIDDSKNVENLKIHLWSGKSMNNFTEKAIRFNQAVGYRATIDDYGLISLEIIVDSEYSGEVIFQTYFLDTLAELHRCLLIVFPKYTEFYIENKGGSPLEGEDLKTWNEFSSETKIPMLLHKYYIDRLTR